IEAGFPRLLSRFDAPATSLLNKYIQSAKLGAPPLDQSWFRHSAITAGGELHFDLGAIPNPSWAAGPASAPPSMSVNPIGDFGCAP
ncbi:MAG: hypothetical protein ACRDH5_12375, partial [bacterium]